jgi:hypothetical protein
MGMAEVLRHRRLHHFHRRAQSCSTSATLRHYLNIEPVVVGENVNRHSSSPVNPSEIGANRLVSDGARAPLDR